MRAGGRAGILSNSLAGAHGPTALSIAVCWRDTPQFSCCCCNKIDEAQKPKEYRVRSLHCCLTPPRISLSFFLSSPLLVSAVSLLQFSSDHAWPPSLGR